MTNKTVELYQSFFPMDGGAESDTEAPLDGGDVFALLPPGFSEDFDLPTGCAGSENKTF